MLNYPVHRKHRQGIEVFQILYFPDNKVISWGNSKSGLLVYEGLTKSQTSLTKKIKPSLTKPLTIQLFHQIPPASHSETVQLQCSGFLLLDIQCGWLLTLFIIMISRMNSLLWNVVFLTSELHCSEARKIWTLAILSKSDKVMSGFKERSATNWTIVCKFLIYSFFS